MNLHGTVPDSLEVAARSDGAPSGEVLSAQVLLRKREQLEELIQDLERRIEQLESALSAQLATLKAELDRLTAAVYHVDALLRFESGEPLPSALPDSPDSATPSSSATGVADAAFALLSDAGSPMHYRDIAGRLIDGGTAIAGKDPAASLLSQIYRDGRFKRTERGTYGLATWKSRTTPRRKTRGRSKRRRSSGR